ncbi:polyprenyl synthetase family protein [Candidatus Mycalebacterium sp.]
MKPETPEIERYITDKKKRVNKLLEKYIKSVRKNHPGLADAVVHTLLDGKKIRPALCAAACGAVGGNIKTAMPAACAIEMIHTYSLIHDDLPSMDDDDTRRGAPSTHKVFGEAKAILAGDLLLTDSFGVLAVEAKAAKIPDSSIVEMVGILSSLAGKSGMAVGQMMDLENTKSRGISKIHFLKTASLFEASVKCGAISGGANSKTTAPLAKYARAVGLAFQTLDDTIDSSDPAREKAGKKKTRELTGKALEELKSFDGEKAMLEKLALYLCERVA